jgi:hypothetical protein
MKRLPMLFTGVALGLLTVLSFFSGWYELIMFMVALNFVFALICIAYAFANAFKKRK